MTSEAVESQCQGSLVVGTAPPASPRLAGFPAVPPAVPRPGRPQSVSGPPGSGGLAIYDTPPAGTFEAIFAALDACSRDIIGPAQPRLLVIPIRDDSGNAAGGFWGYTLFGWLHVQMMFVPEALRSRGVGAALMAAAEAEALARGCRGVHVDAFSFQAVGFYQKLGYAVFGTLSDCPPGHDRLFFCKRLG